MINYCLVRALQPPHFDMVKMNCCCWCHPSFCEAEKQTEMSKNMRLQQHQKHFICRVQLMYISTFIRKQVQFDSISLRVNDTE